MNSQQFTNQISYNKELFDYLKIYFPNTRTIPKREFCQNPQPNRKLKGSVIICPFPECNYHCIEDHDPLIGAFLRHMKKVHHFTPASQFIEHLKVKITYLRNNGGIPYVDPFIQVQLEDLF